MNSILFSILFIFLRFFVFGQETSAFNAKMSLSVGEGFEGPIDIMLIHKDDDYIYASKPSELSKYDLNMNLVSQVKIPKNTVKVKAGMFKVGMSTYRTWLMMSEKLIHVDLNENKSLRELEIFSTEYDKSTLSSKGKKKVYGLKLEKGWDNISKIVYYNTPAFSLERSSEQMGVLCKTKKKNEVKTYFVSFDENAESPNQIELKTSILPLESDINQIYSIDNNLIFGCPGSLAAPQVAFIHVVSNDGDQKTKEVRLKNENNKVITFNIAKKGNGLLHLYGTYWIKSETTSLTHVGGTFVKVYDLKKKEFISEDISPFNFDFRTTILTDTKTSEFKKLEEKGAYFDPTRYTFKKYVLNRDGSATIIGDRIYYGINELFGDLFILRINPEGKIEWCKGLRKRNSSGLEPLGHGPLGFVHNGLNSFTYLHNPLNRAEFSIIKVDKRDGSAEWKNYLNNELDGFSPLVSNRLVENENKAVFIASKNNKNKLLTVEYE